MPVFNRGEGMENENDQELSVNFVDSDNSWTLIQKSLINTIMKLTSQHQSQTCHCSSQSQICLQTSMCRCNNQSQICLQTSMCRCNSQSQTCPCYSQPQICLCNSHCPCSLQYCQPQLHHQLIPSLHYLSLLLLCCRQNAHQWSKNASCRPFQKRTSQLSQNDKDSRLFSFLQLRRSRQQNFSNLQQSWNDQQEQTFNQRWTRGLEMLLNIWIFHLFEVDNRDRF